MTEHINQWERIDRTAAELGAKADTRRKWRRRGVPASWRVKIVQATAGDIRLEDFESLPSKPSHRPHNGATA